MEPALLETFRQQGKLLHCVVRIQVKRVFFQCDRTRLRSSLWTEAQRQARPAVFLMARVTIRHCLIVYDKPSIEAAKTQPSANTRFSSLM